MNKLHESVLKKIGLDEKEIRVYLAALALRSASASMIARKAEITRSTCYGILEQLAQKGLISKTESRGVIQFVADNPELLKVFLESKKANYNQIKAELKNILPDLRNLQGEFGFKPQIEYFEGKGGIIATFKDTYKDVKKMTKNNIPLLVHGSPLLVKNWPEFAQFGFKRLKTGIKIKMLVNKKKMPKELDELHKHYEIRFISDKYDYDAGTNILEDKIILFDLENLLTVIIKNKPLTKMMRIFFEFMWDHSKD